MEKPRGPGSRLLTCLDGDFHSIRPCTARRLNGFPPARQREILDRFKNQSQLCSITCIFSMYPVKAT